ncbi:MAG: VIT domain-containing protein [Pseudomonadota bacterium]|nr:VIT domain-containing protein [Pseudomonadota bacterium]
MLKRCLALLAACSLAAPALATRIAVPIPLLAIAAGAEPIVLRRLAIRAELSGGMAETTVRMVFFNPNRRPLEGTLQFPLLDGQQVSAFALDIDGAMRPAVPVEKAQGRAVFEAIERRGVDPALLETTQGNNFKLRIYPILAGATRTVELKYIEPLARQANQWTYRLPLAYGKVQDFALDVKVNGTAGEAPQVRGSLSDVRFERGDGDYHASVARSDFTPDGTLDIAVAAREQPAVYRQAVDGATYFVAEIPLAAQSARRAAPRTIGLLWDSSGSGAGRALDAELAELERYFGALGKVDVRLIRLRDRAEAPLAFQVRNGDWRALRRALESTVYDGASALNDWQAQPDVDQYLLFSDGLLNYGAAHAPALAPRQRLFALNSSVSADSARLSALAELNGGELITIDPQRPGEAARALLFEQARIDNISARGATDLVAQSRTLKDGMLRVAGRLLATPGQQLVLRVSNGAASQDITVPLDAGAPAHPMAAMLWASWRLRQLEGDYEMHRAEIGRIGRQFGIPTRETSLIVLDRLDDYVRYDIAPPAALKAAFDSLKSLRGQASALERTKHFDTVLRLFDERVTWWNTNFAMRKPKSAEGTALREFEPDPATPIIQGYAPSLAYSAPAPAPASVAARSEAVSVTGRRSVSNAATQGEATPPASVGIALKKWVANAPYIERLRAAPADRVYALYLDEKPGYANSSAFFLDVADILIDKGQRELALRVLSNLAEMDLENRAVLRILGYRLLQAGAPQLAVPVFEKVLRLAQEEPQSFRDLGLAQAAAGLPQQAIDTLYEVVLRPWDSRFPEIETIAIAEINAIVAAARTPLDTRRIDPRLLKNLPLDLRVVLAWDADNADMDLWVTDPDNELCNYSHRLTTQGGKISRDFTRGYGPEEFSLRRARPGKYRIEANYYGNRQQVLAGATTLQVKLFTGFGTARQKEQVITLRLKDKGETVYVGEFEVATSAAR